MESRRLLGALPSPLWGGVGGGGRAIMQTWRDRHLTASPPSPTLPHKGGGSGESGAELRRERSRGGAQCRRLRADGGRARQGVGAGEIHRRSGRAGPAGGTHLPQSLLPRRDSRRRHLRGRSEEHTSELQSRENLVCRLLLEKKKKSSHRLSQHRELSRART